MHKILCQCGHLDLIQKKSYAIIVYEAHFLVVTAMWRMMVYDGMEAKFVTGM